MSKTIKLLSDGTIAKVGMIVFISLQGYKINITKLTALSKDQGCDDNEALIAYPDGHLAVSLKTPSWYIPIAFVRKATAEERKQYYRQLYSNQNG